MSITCVFGTIGNAGMSFTDKINNNLIKMYNYTCKCNNVIGYVDFQKRISDNCDISESNVRMYSPFLYYHGFINEYRNGAAIKVSDFFTPLGKAYIKSLILSLKIKTELPQKKSQNITKDILSLSMFNRKNNGQEDYYFDFLRFCFKYGKICVKEFNYMIYEREIHKLENYIDDIADKIYQFRNGEVDFNFLQDRTSKKGEQVREAFPDNTFNYTRNLLLEAGLIIELDNKEYKINPDKEDVVRLLIKEDL